MPKRHLAFNHYNKSSKGFARALRRNMTKAEACLWKYGLRASNLGVPFRRQRPIDRYIVDFICLPLKLVIEVDGITHEFPEVQKKDVIRQRQLETLGFTVLRFSDDEVLSDINAVLGRIAEVIDELNNQPSSVLRTPPRRGGR